MYRYVTHNSTANENTQPMTKKNQKTVPISLLSGGNSFFVKIKSNQLASNYNDTGNKIKPNATQKINNTYFQKDNKNKSYNKYLNNSQQKNSLVYAVNNSIEYNTNTNTNNTKNTIINKSKQDLFNHNKDIYSFTSIKHNNDSNVNGNNKNNNNRTINTISLRHNCNGVLLTDVELLKKNMNKNNYTIYDNKQDNKWNNNKDKSDISINLNNKGISYRVNKKVLINKSHTNTNNNNISGTMINNSINNNSSINNNNSIISGSLNKRVRTMTEKSNNILNGINKSMTNNNQMKLYKKNQYIIKNNRNTTKNKNLTSIISNNNTSVEKSKNKTVGKDNLSEEKKIILHGQKKNKLICYKEINDSINNNNNNTNRLKDNFIETDEFNNSLSKGKAEKKIKSINIKPNNENLRFKTNNTSKLNFNTINNNKSLIVQKKYYSKNNNNNKDHMNSKSNININNNNGKNTKLINSLGSGDIFELNYTLTELIGPNSINYKNRINKPINYNDKNDKNYLLKKQSDIFKQKEIKNEVKTGMGNKYLISDLTSNNPDRNKNNNCPNIIINNNYLYNYIPLITLNKSTDEDSNNNRLTLNRNSFIDNKIDNKKYKINNSQNFQFDHSQACILNYSSFVGNNNNKRLNNNYIINKDNKIKINRKNNYEQITKVNINDRNSHTNLINSNSMNNNNNNNINNINKYNFHSKYISSSTIDNNINRLNKNEFNTLKNRTNSNNITECFVSKEKNNKKQKQNPPLSKNPKKLNILSLIQENSRKNKDSNVPRQRQFHSFVENDNYNKCYNNNKNIYETIDYILYPDKYAIKDSIDVLDNFDDMNTIIRKINFDNIDVKSNNIFTVNDNKNNIGKKNENYLYTKFCESFNSIFDKKFLNRHQNMSASQNKIKNNNNMYHSKQSGSTKDSNKENSSTKKARVHSYLDNKFEKKNKF